MNSRHGAFLLASLTLLALCTPHLLLLLPGKLSVLSFHAGTLILPRLTIGGEPLVCRGDTVHAR
jgi:hypothetical protein